MFGNRQNVTWPFGNNCRYRPDSIQLLSRGVSFTSEVEGTRHTLSRRMVVAQDAENDLRDQLFADRYFTGTRRPELHGGNMVEEVLRCQLIPRGRETEY